MKEFPLSNYTIVILPHRQVIEAGGNSGVQPIACKQTVSVSNHRLLSKRDIESKIVCFFVVRGECFDITITDMRIFCSFQRCW